MAKTEKLKTGVLNVKVNDQKEGTRIEASKNGGKRAGSGRKPKTDFTARETFKALFDANVTDEDWKTFILACKRDPKLMMYLIDQRIGKAAQAVELSGKDGGAIEVKPILGGKSIKPKKNGK